MKNYRWLLAVALAVIIVLGFWIWRRGTLPQEVDLMALYPSAEKRSSLPVEKAFSVTQVSIDGRTLPAIGMHPTSRLIYKVAVPRDAWFRASLGLKPEAWEKPGDGVLFRFGVSDGRKYDELLNQHVNPSGVPGDRRWIPVTIDLSPYAGQQVDIVLNTNNGPPGQKPDQRWDWAVWGAPQITVKR